MSFDAREVANFFLDHAKKGGVTLTNMTLLKLIYFAHGWHLVYFNKPLVRNTFEAWQYGPVVRIVYEQFRKYGDGAISGRATKFDPVTQTESELNYSFAKETEAFLAQIFDSYAHMHAFKLSEITHEYGSPWYEIWHKSDDSITPGMKIKNRAIHEHFVSLPNRFIGN